MSKNWLIKFFLALGALCLLVSISLPAKNVEAKNLIGPMAQEADEGFVWPYGGTKNSDWWVSQTCHPDGWGPRYNVPSDCAIDFTKYSSASIQGNCGEPAMAPVSGEFSYLGTDQGGSTMGVLVGIRYDVMLLHGDFASNGTVAQGDIIGRENTYGNSTACHWHISVFDKELWVWVNPLTLEATSISMDAGIDRVIREIDFSKIDVEIPGPVTVQPGYLDGLFSVTPTPQVVQVQPGIAVTTPTPGAASQPGTNKIITITNPQTGEPMGSFKLDWSKLPFRVNMEKLGAIWSQHKAAILIGFALLLVFLFSSSSKPPKKEG